MKSGGGGKRDRISLCSAQTPATKDGHHVLRTLLIKCGEKNRIALVLLCYFLQRGLEKPRRGRIWLAVSNAKTSRCHAKQTGDSLTED